MAFHDIEGTSGGVTRTVALIGPFHSGKTTLLESIARITDFSHKKPQNGQHILGDTSPEAKAREMGVELNFLSTEYMGDNYCFIDCPGSIEFLQDSLNILPFVDAAVIVSEADDSRIMGLSPLFKALEDMKIPRFVMINKVDKADQSIHALVDALTQVSSAPVVLRHVPIREGELITGYVDLAAKKARLYRPEKESEIIDMPEVVEERFSNERFALLETLADYDDALLEKLLEDIEPESREVYADLTQDVGGGLIAPVFLGSALLDEGTRRLLKALRHELPPLSVTLARLGVQDAEGPLLQVMKTQHTAHAGKLSICRVLKGHVKDGDFLNGIRISGLFTMAGQTAEKATLGQSGDIVGLGRMNGVQTGDTLSGNGTAVVPLPSSLTPVYALALSVANRSDEVKLSGALTKLCEEDPSLHAHHVEETGELILAGQGEVHLGVAVDRLKSRFGIEVATRPPQVPYRETIRKAVKQHTRHKKQSGGHGQFGDVVVEIEPLPAGSGFQFQESIHGGSIPKQYIPSVETGVRDYLKRGPLGFPVVDVGVKLIDGKYHAVDSSDMAFQIAGRQAMSEAMPHCAPVLLEPIQDVKIHVPCEFTAKVNSLVATRRGQIQGFDARKGWMGWDTVDAIIPQAEMSDLIIELRSLTAGAGTYEARYDHLAEITGRLADRVISQRTSV